MAIDLHTLWCYTLCCGNTSHDICTPELLQRKYRFVPSYCLHTTVTWISIVVRATTNKYNSRNPMIIYRMVIVEGRCDQLTSSSLHTYVIIGWHKSIVSSDWSDTMVWFGQIFLLLSFTILYIWSLTVREREWEGILRLLIQ